MSTPQSPFLADAVRTLHNAAQGTAAVGPTTPQSAIWGGQIAEPSTEPFVSIIGAAGTIAVTDSDRAMPATPPFDVELPFPFTFLTHKYVNYAPLRVGIGGFIGFVPSPDQISMDHGSAGRGSTTYDISYEASRGFTRLLMPYWSDLRGVPGGGIFHRIDLDPAAPGKHVLTIEWRVAGAFWPSGPAGNFQVKLFEAGSVALFLYDHAHPIERSRPSLPGEHFGAAVGMKNLGQAFPRISGCRPGPAAVDDCGVMLFPNADDPALPFAVTRLPEIDHGDGTTPEWYADYALTAPAGNGRPSALFHYSFPPHGYRIKPVEGNAGKMEEVVIVHPAPETEEMAAMPIALGRPVLYPHFPHAGMHAGETPVMICIRSLSPENRALIGVQAQITTDADVLVYGAAIMAGPLYGNGGRIEQYFPAFMPPATGTYRITFTLHDTGFETTSMIDSTSWTFDVVQ